METFLQMIINASAAEFIFSKFPYFQHIVLRLKFENCQMIHLHCKTFDGNNLKMKSTSPKKNKKQYFYLFIDWTSTLVLCTRFSRAQTGAQVK